jgi:hypothetical protein
MLKAVSSAFRRAYKEQTGPEELAKEVEKLSPALGNLVREVGKSRTLYVSLLVIVLFAIKSCTVEVKVDANRLIDQLTGRAPANVINPDDIAL